MPFRLTTSIIPHKPIMFAKYLYRKKYIIMFQSNFSKPLNLYNLSVCALSILLTF